MPFVLPLVTQIKTAGLPPPVEEHLFHPTRKWRFDWAWPSALVAVEIEGGVWKRGGGAHSRPKGILRDIDKANEATLLGWAVVRVTTDMVEDGRAIALIERLFQLRKHLLENP